MSEEAKVIIPRDFYELFGGVKEKEMNVFDIEASFSGGEIGTIKIDSGLFSGYTFAVRRDDINHTWHIAK